MAKNTEFSIKEKFLWKMSIAALNIFNFRPQYYRMLTPKSFVF